MLPLFNVIKLLSSIFYIISLCVRLSLSLICELSFIVLAVVFCPVQFCMNEAISRRIGVNGEIGRERRKRREKRNVEYTRQGPERE